MGNKPSTATAESRVAALAARDHGVLGVSELLACGLTRSGIHRRLRAGRLHPLYRGVYAVGHAAVSRQGRYLAAVKACGPGAVLSRQSAGELWDLLSGCREPIHVTVSAARRPRPGGGLAVHRSRTLADRHTTRRQGVPVTTPARTLADLKRVLPREQWETAVDRARGHGYDIRAVIEEPPTRSALERRFLGLCRRHRIPPPMVNVWVGGFLVDFLWPGSRLIVEVDGYEFHHGRASFEADRARDAALAVGGYRVLRFTHRQVTEAPARVAATVRRMLDS